MSYGGRMQPLHRPALTLPTGASTNNRNRVRVVLTWAVDAAAWTIGLTVAVFGRYGFEPTQQSLAGTAAMIVTAIGVHTMLGHMHFLYRGRYGYGTFEEVRAVAVTVMVCAAVMMTVALMATTRPV